MQVRNSIDSCKKVDREGGGLAVSHSGNLTGMLCFTQ